MNEEKKLREHSKQGRDNKLDDENMRTLFSFLVGLYYYIFLTENTFSSEQKNCAEFKVILR